MTLNHLDGGSSPSRGAIKPWRTLDAVEYATLEWVDWFNHRRLLEPVGNIPPAELELANYRQQDETPWRPDSN